MDITTLAIGATTTRDHTDMVRGNAENRFGSSRVLLRYLKAMFARLGQISDCWGTACAEVRDAAVDCRARCRM